MVFITILLRGLVFVLILHPKPVEKSNLVLVTFKRLLNTEMQLKESCVKLESLVTTHLSIFN